MLKRLLGWLKGKRSEPLPEYMDVSFVRVFVKLGDGRELFLGAVPGSIVEVAKQQFAADLQASGQAVGHFRCEYIQ
jgi:hypothetical protein